jgi:hypothetical protein
MSEKQAKRARLAMGIIIPMREEPKPITDTKGKYRGTCNRTACQVSHESTSIEYWNKSTRAYYCAPCAFLINEANYSVNNGEPLCIPIRNEIDRPDKTFNNEA